MCVCVYMCSTFVPFPSHHISVSLTLHPVIALGTLVFSHAGVQKQQHLLPPPVFATSVSVTENPGIE